MVGQDWYQDTGAVSAFLGVSAEPAEGGCKESRP